MFISGRKDMDRTGRISTAQLIQRVWMTLIHIDSVRMYISRPSTREKCLACSHLIIIFVSDTAPNNQSIIDIRLH